MIRQRMASGKLAKAQRGELGLTPPIGYLRRASGEVVLDPDEQAQHVVRLVFDTFTRLGTLNAVLRFMVDHQIQMPVRVHGGIAKGELEWRRPNRETLQNMLHNPAYAGFYAYGRRQVQAARKIPGRPATGKVVRPRDQWLVLLPDRLPAYISVERYEANLARMATNRATADTPGAPTRGAALLSGLLRCGLCGGHRMTVQYHHPASRSPAHGYCCAYNQVNLGTGGACQHIAGPALDDYVTAQVLGAIAPAALEVSLRAADAAQAERAGLDTLWRQRLERARQAADRARRQYQLAEPENRLVVRHLERQWEQALADVDRLTGEYQRFAESHPRILSAAERAAISTAAQDLPALWHALTTTMTDRKELLRILIEHITVAVVGTSELVDVTIRWAGGHHTTGRAVRPVGSLEQLSYFPRMLALITDLATAGQSTRQIADRLNAEGFRPPKRTSRYTSQQVLRLVNQHGIRVQPRRDRPAALTGLGADQWPLSDLAAVLQMPTASIYNWIYRGWVTAHRTADNQFWIITADDAELQRLRELRNRPPGYYTRKRWTDAHTQPIEQEGSRP